MARARTAGQAQGAAQASRTGDVQRNHQGHRHRGDEAPARTRSGPDRCVPGAACARLPVRLHAFTGAVAQAARRQERGPRAIGRIAADRRARARNREVPRAGILAGHRAAGAGRDPVHRTAGQVRWRKARQAEPGRGGYRQPRQGGGGSRAVPGRGSRDQALPPQSLSAVHYLDFAAGGRAQARFRRQPHDARGAGAV